MEKTRTCKECNIEQPFGEFVKSTKTGETCRVCRNCRKLISKNFKQHNKKYIETYNKQYKSTHKESVKIYNHQYNVENLSKNDTLTESIIDQHVIVLSQFNIDYIKEVPIIKISEYMKDAYSRL